MQNLKTPLDWALYYLAMGLSVIPVNSFNLLDPDDIRRKVKGPAIPWAEYQKRLPTEKEIREWFAEGRYDRMGFVCGYVSRIAVVDVDPGNGGVCTGLDSPIEVKTPSGGQHFYYQYDPAILSSTGTVRPGLDIQADGKFIVAPYSLHWKSSVEGLKRYEWVGEGFSRDSLPLAPSWIRTPAVRPGRFELSKVLAEDISEGDRDVTLTKIAGALMVRFAESEWRDVVLPILRSVNIAKVKPSLPEKDVDKIFISIANKERTRRSAVSAGNRIVENTGDALHEELRLVKGYIDRLNNK